MTTVINNPGNGDGGDSVIGLVVGVLILVLVGVLFFVYGLPAIRNATAPSKDGAININVKMPDNPITTPTPTPAAK